MSESLIHNHTLIKYVDINTMYMEHIIFNYYLCGITRM